MTSKPNEPSLNPRPQTMHSTSGGGANPAKAPLCFVPVRPQFMQQRLQTVRRVPRADTVHGLRLEVRETTVDATQVDKQVSWTNK
jgi:hypothetical protein